jgi:hypothetical protein
VTTAFLEAGSSSSRYEGAASRLAMTPSPTAPALADRYDRRVARPHLDCGRGTGVCRVALGDDDAAQGVAASGIPQAGSARRRVPRCAGHGPSGGRRPGLELPLDIRARPSSGRCGGAEGHPSGSTPMGGWRAPSAGRRRASRGPACARIRWLVVPCHQVVPAPAVRADTAGAVSGRAGCWRASDPAPPDGRQLHTFSKVGLESAACPVRPLAVDRPRREMRLPTRAAPAATSSTWQLAAAVARRPALAAAGIP